MNLISIQFSVLIGQPVGQPVYNPCCCYLVLCYALGQVKKKLSCVQLNFMFAKRS